MAAPLAGGSGASCCVARRAPGVLWVSPVSVRRRLWGGEGVCACGAGLWVMSHRRMPSRCASWRVSRRRLRTYGWSWGAGRLRGWTPRGWSASASMASHAACGIHPPAGRRRQFSTDPLRGRWTRPSREGSPRAHFRSSQSCVWVQRYHHCSWAGLRSWAEEWAWVGVMGSWGPAAVAGLGDSS